jgi:hypothetical protein
MRRLVSTSGILIQSLFLTVLLVLAQGGDASERKISSGQRSQSTSNVISIDVAKSRKAVTHSTSDTVDAPFRRQRVSAGAEELTAASARAGTLQVTALGGGDTCETATVIEYLPFYDTGNTCDFNDNYLGSCAIYGSPDVVYAYTPDVNVAVRISLCDSGYDTVLYVFENDCSSEDIACNDDYCDVQSELPEVQLTAGATYYIVVDGYDNDCGDYMLMVVPRNPACPGQESCCEEHESVGCEDESCCNIVCAEDSYCCETEWDDICVEEAKELCGELCASPPVAECPPDTIFGQPVHGPNDNWMALTSDAAVSPPYLVYENFSGLESEICDVHWWGINAFNDGYEWSSCEKADEIFEIKFYGDAGGSPGAEVCAYTVTPSKIDTDLYYADVFPLYEYHIELEECCYLPSGWVSIQATGDPNCWFMWMSSPTGDGLCYQWDGYDLVPWESDMSLCLTGDICPPDAAQENELCGQDTNGGCNMTNPHFEPISCGDTVCGTVWAQADPLGGQGERDTDWYTIDIPEMGGGCAELIFTVESLFPSAVFILEEGCNPIEILADGYGVWEQPAVVSAVVSTPGTYRLFVAPGTESGPIFSGIACGSGYNDYAASVECIPCCTVECPPGAVDEISLSRVYLRGRLRLSSLC